jgi:D-3-phosphoglycerate dehydrogenase
MRDQTLGIAGLGKIGRRTARKAAALGMQVAAYDPYLADDIFEAFCVERVHDLEDLLERSRFVSLHTPLTPETEGFIGADEIARMPEGSYLVNTARGPVVDLVALADALEKGHLGGAAVDVSPEEPIPMDHVIRRAPHVILTPHAAWFSACAHERMQKQAIDAVLRALSGKRPQNLVNGPRLSRKQVEAP